MANSVQSGNVVDIDNGPRSVVERQIESAVQPHVRRLVKKITAIGHKKKGIEKVHQLRTEARRVTAAINLFEDWLPRHFADTVQKRVRKIRRKAGTVRDLDVLISSLKKMTDLLPDQVLESLAEQAESRRKKEARSLTNQCQKLIGNGFEHDLKALIKQVRRSEHDDNSDVAPDGVPPVTELTGEFESSLTQLSGDAEQMHRVRKSARHLRYSLELIDQVKSSSQLDQPCQLLSKLQDTLGQFNDQVTLLDYLVCCEKESDQQSTADALRHAIHFLEARLPEQKTSIVNRTMEVSKNVLAILNGSNSNVGCHC